MIDVTNGFCIIKNKEYTLLDSDEDDVFYFYRNDGKVISKTDLYSAGNSFTHLYELYVRYYLDLNEPDEFFVIFKDTDDEKIMKVTIKRI